MAEPSPTVVQPPIVKRNITMNKNLSITEIEKKLKEAEERRLVCVSIYKFLLPILLNKIIDN